MQLINFILIYFFFTFSVIGYGYFFSKNFTVYNKASSIGFIGIYGIFLLTLISFLTNLFIKHDYFHNIIIILVGIFFFAKYQFPFKNLLKSKDFKYYIFFLSLSIFSILYFKSHDDFPYYHLSFINNITENKVEFGLGIFDLAFNHVSSLFFFHSLFRLPFTGDYFYFLGPVLIMTFANTILINEILINKKKNISYNIFFNIFILVFINIFFYRLAEHGTDRSAIILILLCISLIFQILTKKKLNNQKFENFIIFLTLIVSLKSFYAIYGLLFVIIFFKFYSLKKFKIFYKEFKIINITIIFSLLILFYNIAYTGCLIYPLPFTCFKSFYWGMDITTIEWASNFYELWSKAGATPSYKVVNPDEYIKGLNWLTIWIDNYFFNKVSDYLLSLLFIVIVFSLIFRPKKFKINYPKNYNIVFIVLFLFLVEWFLKHPSLRYGGYHLIAIIFFIPTCILLGNQDYIFKENVKKVSLIVLITLVVFVGRNLNRITNEYKVYNYNPFISPVYRIKNKDYVLSKRKQKVL